MLNFWPGRTRINRSMVRGMVYDKVEKMNPYKLQDTFEVMMFSSYEEHHHRSRGSGVSGVSCPILSTHHLSLPGGIMWAVFPNQIGSTPSPIPMNHWLVVSNMFDVHAYLGKIPILTNIFPRGWNHGPDHCFFIRFYSPLFFRTQVWDAEDLLRLASTLSSIRLGCFGEWSLALWMILVWFWPFFPEETTLSKPQTAGTQKIGDLDWCVSPFPARGIFR